jgi:uncharacterized phiE125 gp8 family phage protein
MEPVYTRTDIGTVPVNVVDFKTYIKLPQVVVADDALITTLLATATIWGENYTRRDFRDNTWEMKLDTFPNAICIRRDPVETITSVTYEIAGVVTTVDASDYYLLKQVQTSWIVLNDGFSWPTDGDEVTEGKLGTITVTFTTTTYSCEDDVQTAIKMHTAHMYSERGDCPASDAARKSGATGIYDQFRVSKV